ncbi:MAG: lasso peptide biosynthesis B2 protein [Candidatus Competibacteraceae bacterium]
MPGSKPVNALPFLSMGLALALIPLALSVLGLPRLLARFDADGKVLHGPGVRPPPAESVERAQLLALYADFWLRCLRLRNPCLRRSLVLFKRLRRYGLPVTFYLGIHRDGATAGGDLVRGHAWLELDGQVILEPAAAITAQVRTFCYPPPASP